MNNYQYILKYVRLASQLDRNERFSDADQIFKLVTSAASSFPVLEEDFSRQDDSISKDTKNPISIWGKPDQYAAYKNLPGSGVYTTPDNIMSILKVPSRFLNKTFDEVMSEINNSLPKYDPLRHGNKFNFLNKIIPNFVKQPENLEFFKDTRELLTSLRKYLSDQIFPTKFSDDPEVERNIRKNLDKFFEYSSNTLELNSALNSIR
jgi:hypothetical protein